MPLHGFLRAALLVVFVAVQTVAARGAGPIRLFTTPEREAGIAPYDVALADVEGDCDLDVLTSDIRDGVSGSVSLLRNLGSGVFAMPETFMVGADARSLAATDLTGDGRPDVAVCNYQDSTISVLRNTGGSFSPLVVFNAGYLPLSVCAGDLDGDSDKDLVWVSESGYVYVARNPGNGVFGSMSSYYMGVSPYAAALGDFDRDGDLDIASVSYGSWYLMILRNNGSGAFTGPTYYASYYTPSEITVGDFNSDSWPDIAVASGAFVSVFLNSGTGTFLPYVNYPVGESSTGIASADFDSDGLIDIAAANYLGNSVSVLRNLGAGVFGGRRDWGVGMNPQNVAAGDVTGDGRPDIIVADANLSSNTISVAVNLGASRFLGRQDFALKGYGSGITAADFDRDGKVDIAGPGEEVGNFLLCVFRGNGDGTLGQRNDITIPYKGTDLIAVDVDLDGWPDIALSQFSPGNRVLLFRNNRAGGFHPPTHHPVHSNALGLAAGDFNGDGWPDIAVANASQLANTVSILINNGSGGLLPEYRIAVGVRPVDVAIADFNLDKRDDIIVVHDVSSFVTVLTNIGNGAFSRLDIPVGTSLASVRCGDLNSDGKPDAVIADVGYTYGRVGVMLNSAGALTPPSWVATQGAGSLALSDLDFDGDLDIAFTSSYDRVGILENLGKGSFGALGHFRSGYNAARLVAADLDRDGRQDVVISNNRARSVSVLINITHRLVPMPPSAIPGF